MNMKGRETLNPTKVIYLPQEVKNILSISRLVTEGFTMGATQDKMNIKKNCFNMILDAIK